MKDDQNYCGLGKLNTGPKDPYWKEACVPHDEADQAIIDGKPTETPLQSFRKFVSGCTKVAVTKPSLWTISAYLPFLLIGGIGGVLRQQQLLNRLNGPTKRED